MKLGLVRRGYSASGGAEAYLRRFAEGLASAGHTPVLFTGDEWPADAWPHELRRVPGGGSPAAFARALAALRPRDACDFLFSLERVQTCDAYRAGDGVHAAWLARRACSEAFFKPLFRRAQPKHRELLRLEEAMFAGGGAARVICNSRMVSEEVVARYRYPAEKITVVYNGVPPAASPETGRTWRAEARRELGLHERDYVLLFAGSGWERKGLRRAVEAMNEAALSRPLLLVAGKGDQARMPASSRVRYLGEVSGVARWLAAADAFLLPTLYDPFSNACLEALAAGLPVITSSANGFAEILAPGEGTVVDDPTDIRSLALAIESWAPPDRRAAVREALRAKGAAFPVERNVRETLVALGVAPPGA